MESYSLKPLFFAALVATLLSGVGCSTAKVRVMPGENGENRVVVTDIEKDDAEEAAVKGANEYCENLGKTAVFVKHETKYTGSMDESTRNTVRNASAAASMIGFHNRTGTAGRHSEDPNVFENAGMAGSAMTNDRDYKSEMIFKCK